MSTRVFLVCLALITSRSPLRGAKTDLSSSGDQKYSMIHLVCNIKNSNSSQNIFSRNICKSMSDRFGCAVSYFLHQELEKSSFYCIPALCPYVCFLHFGFNFFQKTCFREKNMGIPFCMLIFLSKYIISK